MNSLRRSNLAAFSIVGLAALLSWPVGGAARADGLRPAVAAPLQAAERALSAKEFAVALRQVAKADAVRGKTPEETLDVERVRAAVDVGRQDEAAAAADYGQIIATGGLPPDQLQLMAQGEASLDYQAGNYAGAIGTIKSYLSGDPQYQPILLQSYFKLNECSEIEAAVGKHSKPPPEAGLQMVASCDSMNKDDAGYRRAMSALVAYYPTPAYWTSLLAAEQSNPAFSDQLALDFFRLKLVAGVPATEAEFMDMTQAALQGGLANQAAAIMAQGYSSGVLGSGPDAARQTRLKALVAQRQALANANLQQQIAVAKAAQDEPGLLGIGFNEVDGGNPAGLDLMAGAIRSGKLSRPGQAELELGIAYRQAGQRQNAEAMWQSVQGGDGAAELGKLWMYLR